MRFALLETNIIWEDKERNIEVLIGLLDMLKESNLDIVFLPEMSFTGFSMNVDVTKDVDRETIERMKELSIQYNVMISFGWVGLDQQGYRNHYSIVNKEDLELDYIKIHPFSYGGEAKVFAGGDKLNVANILGFAVGTQICYDLRFPEPFQILSKQASIIVVPANWPAKREDHWDTLLKARAIENQTYIAGINCRGKIGEIEYSGHSALYSPYGERVNEEESMTCDNSRAYIFDLKNDVEKARESFPVKNDRKEQLYIDLIASQGDKE